jgi:hypothetical protein
MLNNPYIIYIHVLICRSEYIFVPIEQFDIRPFLNLKMTINQINSFRIPSSPKIQNLILYGGVFYIYGGMFFELIL